MYNTSVVTDKDFCLMPLPVLLVLPLRCGVKHFRFNMKKLKCSECKEMLPVDRFGKNKHFPRGYQYHCKKCRSQFKNKEKARINAKKYRERNPEKTRMTAKRWVKENPDKVRQHRLSSNKKQKLKDPEQFFAGISLRKAVKNGYVFRPDFCYLCDITCKPEGHHEDYSQSLDVLWLCHTCHIERHEDINKEALEQEG